MVRWIADSVRAWLTGLMLCLVTPALLLVAEHLVHKRLSHWRKGKHNVPGRHSGPA